MREETKYQFVVRKERERPDTGPTLRDPFGKDYRDVFTVDVEADEFIELMEHLWRIAEGRRRKKNSHD